MPSRRRSRLDRDALLAALPEDDPAARWRGGIAAFYEVFRQSRAVTLAAAGARTTSEEVRAVWSQVVEEWVQETTEAIEAERERGAAPAGPPAPTSPPACCS